jgi:nucleotide-binding universal stress UspA family protein
MGRYLPERAKPPLVFKQILVALDGSDCSHKALDMAVQLANEQGARYTVTLYAEEALSVGQKPTWNELIGFALPRGPLWPSNLSPQ